MKVDVVQCEGCGADLPPDYGKVRCEYCGKVTRIRRSTVQQPAVQQAQQASAWDRPEAQAPARSKVGCAAIAAFASLALVAGGVALVMVAPQQAEQRMLPALEAMEEAMEQAAQHVPSVRPERLASQTCLLDDVTGDGVGEIAALFSRGDRLTPRVLDGASGTAHWSGEERGDGSHVHLLCLGSEWFAIADNDAFSLTLFHASDLGRPVTRALSDELEYFGVGDDCLRFRTKDRQQVGFSIEDGSERSCGVRARSRPHIGETTRCGIVSTSRLRRGMNYSADDVDYHLTTRRPGTAFLRVTAKRGRHELWEQTLRTVPVGGDAIGCFVAAAAPGSIVVLGSLREDDHSILAIGLNAETGTERFATPLDGSLGHVKAIHYNGRYVVVGLLDRVVAIAPTTGEIAW